MTARAPKQEILDAAFAVLMRDGLPWLSYDAVASAAGTSRQRVRYHFPDPDTLMVALCDRMADAYRTLLTEGAAEVPGPHRLGFFLDFYFGMLEGTPKPRDDAAYDAAMALAVRSATVRGTLRAQYGLLAQVVCHEVRVAHPEIDLPSAEEIGYAFVALMYGHWKMVASLGLSDEHGRIARAAMDRLISTYRAGAAPLSPPVRLFATAKGV